MINKSYTEGFSGFQGKQMTSENSAIIKRARSSTLSCGVLIWIWETDLNNFGIRLLCLVSAKHIKDTLARQAVRPSVKYCVT